MKIFVSIVVAALTAINAHADDSAICRSISEYQTLLDSFVHDGRVNYKQIDRDLLARAVKRISQCDAETYDRLDEQSRIALWINAYNLLTIDVVMAQYPIKSSWFKTLRYPKNSIRQINGAWTNYKYRIAGREVSLDDIEHNILRREFQEPRIHFAVNCASIGCPVLAKAPYIGEKLDSQLDSQVLRFLNNPRHGVSINKKLSTLHLSSILDWFGKDFFVAERGDKKIPVAARISMTEKAIVRFLARYAEPADRDWLLSHDYEIDYLEYDWTLNES